MLPEEDLAFRGITWVVIIFLVSGAALLALSFWVGA
jgi:hypothetical protein